MNTTMWGSVAWPDARPTSYEPLPATSYGRQASRGAQIPEPRRGQYTPPQMSSSRRHRGFAGVAGSHVRPLACAVHALIPIPTPARAGPAPLFVAAAPPALTGTDAAAAVPTGGEGTPMRTQQSSPAGTQHNRPAMGRRTNGASNSSSSKGQRTLVSSQQ